MTAAQLLKKPCPASGEGVHTWVFYAACRLVEAGWSDEQAEPEIEALMTREPNPASEIRDELRSARGERRRSTPRWAPVNPAAIAEIAKGGPTLVELISRSPEPIQFGVTNLPPDELRNYIAHWAGRVWFHSNEMPTADRLRDFDLMSLEGAFRKYIKTHGEGLFEQGMTVEEIWAFQQLISAEPWVTIVRPASCRSVNGTHGPDDYREPPGDRVESGIDVF